MFGHNHSPRKREPRSTWQMPRSRRDGFSRLLRTPWHPHLALVACCLQTNSKNLRHLLISTSSCRPLLCWLFYVLCPSGSSMEKILKQTKKNAQQNAGESMVVLPTWPLKNYWFNRHGHLILCTDLQGCSWHPLILFCAFHAQDEGICIPIPFGDMWIIIFSSEVLGKQALDLKKMFAVGEIPDLNGSKFSNWWFQPTPLKNDGPRQLGWWHSIPNWMESHKTNVPNHQPVLNGGV